MTRRGVWERFPERRFLLLDASLGGFLPRVGAEACRDGRFPFINKRRRRRAFLLFFVAFLRNLLDVASPLR